MRSVRRFRFQYLVRTRLWLLPLICVLTGIGAAVALLAIDKASGYSLVGQGVTGSASSAQSILSVASSALVTLTTIVLSLTLVAVQLAMGQFSPRIVRAILHDRRSQLAIGLFIGTFTYSMTVLRELNGNGSGSAPVPGLAVVVDYALILCAIVTLVLFVHHTAQSIRVGGLIGLVGDETRRQVNRLHAVVREPSRDPSVVPAPEYGIVVELHHRMLVGLAAQADCLLELVPAMGDFVPRDSPLFRVHGAMRPSLRDAVARGVILGRERTHDFEPAFRDPQAGGRRRAKHLLGPLPRSHHISPGDQCHPRRLAPAGLAGVSVRRPPGRRREATTDRAHDDLGRLRKARLRRAAVGRSGLASGGAAAARSARGHSHGGPARTQAAA
jgi:uncharacterized membrane protein